MFYYNATFVPNKFLVVGAGGTGSRLVPLLCQFLKTLPWIPSPQIVLADPDVVEEKNLVRQNFIRQDIGKNKAVVLATRYSRHYEMNIHPHPHAVQGGNESLFRVFSDRENTRLGVLDNAVIFLCVDSIIARKQIVKTLLAGSPSARNKWLILDAGNEDDFGQIKLFTTGYGYCPDIAKKDILPQLVLPGNLIPFDVKIPDIPLSVGDYANMKEGKATGGCADLDQTLAINTQMAVNMLSIFQNFCYGKRILYHRLNVSLTEGAQPQYITLPWLLENSISAPDMPYSTNIGGTGEEKLAIDVENAALFLMKQSMSSSSVITGFSNMYQQDVLSPLIDFRDSAGLPVPEVVNKHPEFWSENRKKRISMEKLKAIKEKKASEKADSEEAKELQDTAKLIAEARQLLDQTPAVVG